MIRGEDGNPSLLQDQGLTLTRAFNQTGMAKTLSTANAKATGTVDGGYSSPFIVSPVVVLIGGYSEEQAASRAVVEKAIGRIHTLMDAHLWYQFPF